MLSNSTKLYMPRRIAMTMVASDTRRSVRDPAAAPCTSTLIRFSTNQLNATNGNNKSGGFMYLRSAIQIFAVYIVVFAFVFPPEVFGDGVETRVVFQKGKTSARYKGKLPREYADYDSYYFRARKGQTLSVRLATDKSEGYLAIYETKVLGPDEDTILGNDEKSRDWSGKLPVTGEYSVQVYGVGSMGTRSSGAAYTIEISIR